MTTPAVKPINEDIEPVAIEDLKRAVLVPKESFEAWLQSFDWTYSQLFRKEYPAPFTSLEEFQLACLCADPVLWVQAFLREPEDPDHQDPYSLWDYQKEALRHRDHKIYDCGAETGKTRDIVADSMYMSFTERNGNALIGAPQQTHLDEIIEAMYEQMTWNPDLFQSLKRWKKHPHHAFYFDNGFKIDFRPSGHDGEAFRGVHARTFVKLDEAAKMKNPMQWSEFWRSMKPQCIAAIYSVTDGDRSCDFFKLKERAKRAVTAKKIEEDLDIDLPDHLKNRTFRHYRWPKTIMPSPYWSEARRRFYIEQYGGEDSPGYKHNVLAEDGDPENSVFPWQQFSRLLKDIPEYRCLKILIDDSQGEAILTGTTFKALADGKSEAVTLLDTRIGKSSFDIRAEIKAFFSAASGALRVGGADLGFSQDPSELYVKVVVGKAHRLIARVQLRGVTYDDQDTAIDALDDVFTPGGWGVDFGNAGSAVVHNLISKYPEKSYDDRLTGFQFGAVYDAVNEEGDVIFDKKTGKPVKLMAKELSTDLLVKKMQRQELEYPYDPDLILYYPNHTYRESQNHRIYKKEDDHVIDADRVLMLRQVLGTITNDDFACGSRIR